MIIFFVDTSDSPEDNIDNITRSLQQKDFVITKGK